MSTANALFEAPATHEAEMESEHGFAGEAEAYAPESQFSTEFETGMHESQYNELEGAGYSGEFEDELGSHEQGYSGEHGYAGEHGYSGEHGYAGEHGYSGESGYSTELEGEFEFEGDPFLGGFLKKALSAAKRAAGPIAKRLAPIAARSLIGMIPGIGAIAGPIAGRLVQQLVKEGEAEAEAQESAMFASGEAEGEVAQTESAHEAALAEVLAAQAAEAATEAEAEAMLGAALPITITIMSGGRRPMRTPVGRVTPVLATATARLAQTLRRNGGPASRNLLRVVPSIHRRTVASLRAAARRGTPVTANLAVRTMAAQTRSVLSNPQTVQNAISRNIKIRQKQAPPHGRRGSNGAPAACAHCLGRTAARVS
jgi:hypothetical protein